jgi:hypothetical protein
VRPLHVTFTGLDAATRTHELLALSRDFPIEWGILFHPTQEGSGRYPALAQIRLVAECDLKVSAHLCGGYARSIVHGESLPATVVSLLNRFSRIQINTSERGIEPERIARFTGRFGARGILQCRGFEHFPDNTDVDWLFDRSGGKGRLPAQWPVPEPAATFVGYSGGLGPETVADALKAITRQHRESIPFWIDMEGAIRTDDVFDVSKCRRVCEIVFG